MPLHKKGDIRDPDNYRAIALGSAIGKLFSALLLDRFITFKKEHSPDPQNQMGFTKGAQTLDHILTIRTVVEKYKLKKKKVYCVFVDLKKAFDSVPREALLFKIARTGITGKMFNVIQNMYQRSTCQLRMDGKLTEKFPVERGTEQGHTLSPELFKTYAIDASHMLNALQINAPELGDVVINHLLWADDLVLLALDLESAQTLLNTFTSFCTTWGLDINIIKTNLVIFNKRSLKNNTELINLDGKQISTVESYCYLGLVLHMNGSVNPAVENLRSKSLRALFALRNYVNRESVSIYSLLKLFDFLIKPIITYGSPIWTPHLLITKTINRVSINERSGLDKLYKVLTSNSVELLHLKHLKWILGIHRKSSNIASWGELGRIPIIDSCIKQAFSYYRRLDELGNQDSLVKLAFLEQKRLNLQWFANITKLKESINAGQPNNNQRPLESLFQKVWYQQAITHAKLELYQKLKPRFESRPEPYLTRISSHKHRSTITKLRVSAHQLLVETGRYRKIPREERICNLCSGNAVDNEHHLLVTCSSLNEEREKIVSIVGQHNISAVILLNMCSSSCCIPDDNDYLLIGQNKVAKKIHQLYVAKLKLSQPDSTDVVAESV